MDCYCVWGGVEGVEGCECVLFMGGWYGFMGCGLGLGRGGFGEGVEGYICVVGEDGGGEGCEGVEWYCCFGSC